MWHATRKFPRALAIVTALCFVLAACGGDDTETPEEGTEAQGTQAADVPEGEAVRVGVVDSLTGATAVAGQANVCGFRLAREVIHERGDGGGRSYELVIEDDESTAAVAAERATALTEDGIELFVGGSTSSVLLAMIPILNDAGALHTGGTSQSTEVIAEGERIVRLNSNSEHGAELYGEHISENYESVVFVALEGAFGEGAVEGVKSNLSDDVQILDEIYVPPDTTDYQTVVTTIAQLEPDVVVWSIFGNEQPVGFMRDFQRADLDVVSLAGAGVLSASLANAADGGAEGVMGFDVYSEFAENEENDALKAAYDEHADSFSECEDKPLDKQIGVSYSQLLLLAQAIDRANSTDPDVLYDEIIGSEFSLPVGDVEFGESGQSEVNWYQVVGTSDGIEPAE